MGQSDVRLYNVSTLLLLSAMMAMAFVGVAVEVARGGWVVLLDQHLASLLGEIMSPTVLWLLSCFTYLGDRHFLTGFVVALLGVLLLQRVWRDAMVGLAITVGAGGMTTMIKHVMGRMRPEHVHGYVYESGWSFPSGHSSASAAVYGFACYFVLRRVPSRWHGLCLGCTAVLVVGIGLSRVLLQVHYLSDVVAGFLLSLSWLAFCFAIYALVFARKT